MNPIVPYLRREVMPWFEKPWGPEAVQRYLSHGFTEVFIQFTKPLVYRDLEFVHELPGLCVVRVEGRVKDDTAVFGDSRLHRVELLTRCKRPIPPLAESALTRVGIDDRAGKEELAAAANLADLEVWLWGGEDFGFLRGMASLARLRVEAKHQLVSLAGFEGCASLSEVDLFDLRVDGLGSLRGLSQLRRLSIMGSSRMRQPTVLDLNDLGGLGHLESLELITAGSVRSLRPLTRLPRLRYVRLGGTQVLDGDLSPLDHLHPDATISRPDS